MSREALEYFSCFEYGTRDCISTVCQTLPIWKSHLTISVFHFFAFLPSLFPQLRLSCPDFLYFCFVYFCIPLTPLKKKPHLRTLSGSVYHPYPWEITNNMGVRAGFISTPALPEDKQLWTCSKSYCNGPPAAGDDSDLWAVWRRGAKVTGGPPLLLTGAAHMEDIPKMKRQGLISRAEVWDTSVIIEQRSAEKKKTYIPISHFYVVYGLCSSALCTHFSHYK